MTWKCRLTVWSPLWDPHACRTRPGTSNGKTAGRMSCRKATSSCRRLHSSRRRWAAPRRPERRGHRGMEECEPVKPSTLEIQTIQVCYCRYSQVALAQSFLLLQGGWGVWGVGINVASVSHGSGRVVFMLTFRPSSQLSQRSPRVRKQTTARLARWLIQPSFFSWAMTASIQGKPVRPSAHLATASGFLSQGIWTHTGLPFILSK